MITSIEQSKHLVELGIDIETADSHWRFEGEDCYRPDFAPYSEGISMGDCTEQDIPAWTTDGLIKLMPKCIIINGDNYFNYIALRETVSYGNCDMETAIMFTKGELINAVYEMVCWLVRNRYIKTKIR